MKRLITFICLIIVVFVGYYFISKGIENDTVNIASYEIIEKKSNGLTKKLAVYNKKNEDEYESVISKLNDSIKSYKDSKSKYQEILEELSDVINQNGYEDVIYSDKEKYKVDFLLVTLGYYGEKEGVDVVYQLTTSSTTDPSSTSYNYFLADLNFTVTGQYMNVANFISDLENDEKLSWEIRNFSMENGTANGYTGVSAKFTIKDVPIDSESYIASNAIQSLTNTENGDVQPENSTTTTTITSGTTSTDTNQ